MNILFLTLVNIESINDRNIYADLMRKFNNEGHNMYIVIPTERRLKQETEIFKQDRVSILKVKTLNIQKTNIIEKGISTLLIENKFLTSIKKYFSGVKFDLILYSTPPITFTKVIRYIKQRDKAISYLLLKDIFPQNAVDLGMMNKGGLIYRYFRNKEKQLYNISDFIGCMSPANVSYLIKHNPEIDASKVEVNPNSLEPDYFPVSKEEITKIREINNIPLDATAFIYGGNIGKPQGIDFLIKVVESNFKRNDIYFVVVGSGTEFHKIKAWFDKFNPINACLIAGLPKAEYDKLVKACNVGLILLDNRFTISNYPSRLLSYLENKVPILAAIDINSDIGKIAEKNGYGFWCINGDLNLMNHHINSLASNTTLVKEMGNKGFEYLNNNYTSKHSYEIILSHIN